MISNAHRGYCTPAADSLATLGLHLYWTVFIEVTRWRCRGIDQAKTVCSHIERSIMNDLPTMRS